MAIDPITALTLLNVASSAGGALASLLGKKKQAETVQIPGLTPEQQRVQSNILEQALSRLSGNMAGFDPIAQKARTDFQTQTVPSLAERFTSMGQGAQRSSGFREALGAAGSGLEESLASMGSQRSLQEQGLLQSLLGLGLRPSFESLYMPQQLGGAQQFGASLFQNSMQNMAPLLQLRQLSKMSAGGGLSSLY